MLRIVLAVLILTVGTARMCAQQTWIKTYGGSVQCGIQGDRYTQESGRAIAAAPGGGWVITGHTALGQDGDFGSFYTGGQRNDLPLAARYNLCDWDIGNYRDPYHVFADAFVVKVDVAGRIVWKRIIGGSAYAGKGALDIGTTVASTPDGGWIVAGYSESGTGDFIQFGRQDKNIFVAKLNSEGILQWVRRYGGSDIDFPTSIVATPDGGSILCGMLRSKDGDFLGMGKGFSFDTDNFVMKIDSVGTIVWKNSIAGSGAESENLWNSWSIGRQTDFRAPKVRLLADGSIVMMGQTNSNDGDFQGLAKGYDDLYVAKLDQFGNKKWVKTYGGDGQDRVGSMTVANDGSIFLVGKTGSTNTDFQRSVYGAYSAVLLKLDTSGVILRKTFFGNNNGNAAEVNSVAATPDGGCVVSGFNLFNGVNAMDSGDFLGLMKGNNDAFIFRFDANGALIRKRVFGGTLDDYGGDVAVSSAGDIAMTGCMFSNDGDFNGLNKGGNGNNQTRDIFIVTMEADPCQLSITSDPVGVTVKDGQQTSLSVAASSPDPIQYQWQRKVGDAFVNISNDGRFFGATSSKLVIESAQESRKGPYRCVVSSGACSANSAEATFTVSCACK